MAIDLDDPIAVMLVAAAALERSGAPCAATEGSYLQCMASRAKRATPILPLRVSIWNGHVSPLPSSGSMS
jgi:hypothetical protein